MISFLLPLISNYTNSNFIIKKSLLIIYTILLILSLTMRLDLIHHNVRNWGIHKNNLSNYYLKHNPDIISINSHGLNTDKDQFLKIFSYSNLTSGTGLHAGTALLCKTNLKHAHFTPNMDNNSLYSIIHTDLGKILIFSLYRPPRINALPLIDIKNALNLGLPTLILGDFNIHHTNFGHNRSDNLGKIFNNFALRNNLHFLGPHFKTYFNNINSGTPDLIFGNNQILNLAVQISPGDRLPFSDHIPIHIKLNSNPIAIPADPKFNLHKANWEEFREELSSIPLPNIHNKDLPFIDDITQNFINNIINASENHIPKSHYKFIPSFNLSNRTKRLQLIYNQRHQLYHNNLTIDKSRILLNIKHLIDESTYNDFSRFWTNKLNSIIPIKNTDPSKFFSTIKHLRGTGKHNTGTYLKINNDTLTDPQAQAMLLLTLGRTHTLIMTLTYIIDEPQITTIT